MRKKIFLLIMFTLVFFIGLSINSSITGHAAVDVDNDIAYTYDDYLFTESGVTVEIDNATQVWTISGTSSSNVVDENAFTLYASNTSGSSLDPNKSYVVYYEYISGSVSGDTASSRLFFSSKNLNSIQSMSSDDYQNSRVIATFTKGLFETADIFQLNLIGSSTLVTTFDAYKFKMNIYEINTITDFKLFDDTYSGTNTGVSISVATGDTVTLNGTLSSGTDITHDISTVINDVDIDITKNYLVSYEYISGTLSASNTAAYIFHFLYINASADNTMDNNLKVAAYDKDYGVIVSGSELANMSFELNGALSQTITYDNLIYKYYIQEIGTPAVEPSDGYDLADWIQSDGYLIYDIANNLPTELDGIASIYFNPIYDVADYEFAASSNLTHQPVPANTTGIKLLQTIDAAFTVHYQIVFHPSDEIIMISETNPDALWDEISIRLAVTPAVVNYYVDDVIDSSENSIVGEKIVKPVDPTKTGYTFIGWYLEDTFETLYDFNTDHVDAETFNLYARFVEDTVDVYTVSFDENGGSLVDDRIVVSGEAIAAPTAPTRSGYTFNGWFTDEELTTAYDFTSLVSADTTLYAKWTESATTPVTPSESSLGVVEWIFIGAGALAVGYAVFFGKKK